ncbi:MAG: undecaprenyl/decaprenyl-phosphate alpha-N-acetylglucosaminyl 1-phosphate transferase, partial [Ignavibacterium sp.]
MTNIAYYIAALAASIVINSLFIKFWKFDFLKSTVKSDRWGTKVVPLTGGISIFIIFTIFSLLKINEILAAPLILIALAGGVLMFTLGLIDDIIELKSHQKFLFQIIIVVGVVYLGVETTLFPKPLNFAITVLWILGITNAFNLLDNIDGLAAGIATIAALTLGVNFFIGGNILLSNFCFLLAAVILGFLIFNFNPAKIYLGDSGSLFVGYILSTLTILGAQATGKSFFVGILFPVMIMMIPVLDTMLVSITRRIRGQSPFEGGRDHLSHRLVMLGMSEKQSVLFLYFIAILLAISTFIITDISPALTMMIYFFICLIIILFGFYVGRIKVVTQNKSKNDIVSIGTSYLYRKRIFHILVDVILLAFIYFFSYVIRFEGDISKYDMNRFVESLPIVVFIKMMFLYFFKVYKIETRYFSVSDGLQFIKGVSLS